MTENKTQWKLMTLAKFNPKPAWNFQLHLTKTLCPLHAIFLHTFHAKETWQHTLDDKMPYYKYLLQKKECSE